MKTRVLLETPDLLFRSKLRAVVAAGDAELARDEAASDLVVIELRDSQTIERIVPLVERGIPVLAFGAHVGVELLRAARDAGAVAVPNSQVEARLRALLTS